MSLILLFNGPLVGTDVPAPVFAGPSHPDVAIGPGAGATMVADVAAGVGIGVGHRAHVAGPASGVGIGRGGRRTRIT